MLSQESTQQQAWGRAGQGLKSLISQMSTHSPGLHSSPAEARRPKLSQRTMPEKLLSWQYYVFKRMISAPSYQPSSKMYIILSIEEK